MTRARTYWIVWGALLALAGASLALALLDLGPAAVPVALGIATVKACLVVAFFMHALEQRGTKWVFLLLAVLLLSTLVGLMALDVETRETEIHGMDLRPDAAAREIR